MRTKANRERARKARYAITFGLEADAVRQGPCVAFDRLNEHPRVCGCKPRALTIEDSLVLRWDPAHIVSVGAGGGRFDLISLCSAHHRQQHNMGIDSFAAVYGLDLRALADAQALAHEPPLGVRGLAARWAAERTLANMDPELCPELEERAAALVRPLGVLEGYDLAALLGWVRRRMAAEVIARRDLRLGKPSWPIYRPGDDWDGDEDDDRSALSFEVGGDLGGEFQYQAGAGGQALTEALCELAGWPS